MIRLNSKNMNIISIILALIVLGFGIGWYYTTEGIIKDEYIKSHNDAAGPTGIITHLPEWFWIRIVLWPTLIIVLGFVVSMSKFVALMEVVAIINILLAAAGFALGFTTLSYEGVANNISADYPVYIVYMLLYPATMIASGFIAFQLLMKNAKVWKANKTKGIADDEKLTNEDIVDIN